MLEVDVVRISVIVPIYNVKLYIERCVRSLMEQTLENIEFIFVNDCTPDDSMDILRNWVVKRAELLNKRDCNALFISNRRTRITDKSVRDLVKAYTADFEKHITPHKFRSTFATLLYDQTGDIAYVQQLMNHSRPDTTQRYIVRKPINAEAAKYVNSLLK